jgi:hypothetical protein
MDEYEGFWVDGSGSGIEDWYGSGSGSGYGDGDGYGDGSGYGDGDGGSSLVSEYRYRGLKNG